MAITAQDYHLTDVWETAGGQKLYNVYYVRSISGPQTALDVLNCFINYMTPRIQDILHSTMTNVLTEAYSLTNPADFGSVVSSLPGLIGGGSEPTFVAAAFSIIRSTRDFRNSGKRYGRISENDVNGNAVDSLALGRFGAVQDGLTDTWINGLVECQLMIPKRVPVLGKYVLDDLQRPSSVGNGYISSQNSRK